MALNEAQTIALDAAFDKMLRTTGTVVNGLPFRLSDFASGGAFTAGNGLQLSTGILSVVPNIGLGTVSPTEAIHLYNNNILVESPDINSQKCLIQKMTGIIGVGSYASLDPVFYTGKIFVGGIGSPEWQLKYSDSGSGADGLGPAQAERVVMEIEKTGTLATISDDALRAHYEAYTHGLQNGHSGAYKPVMRLSSYPYMQFQAGPPCSLATAGMMTRSGTTVTVNFTAGTPYAHDFSVGDPLYMTGAETGFTMSEGTLTVATVPNYYTFTYTDVSATAAANTLPVTFTIEPDVTVGRSGAKTLDIRTNVVSSPSAYSMRFQPTLVQTPSTVTLNLLGPLSVTGDVGTVGEVLTSAGPGLPPTWGAGGGGGHVIEDDGTPVTQRANLNFTGPNVVVTDEAGVKTTVTIGGDPTITDKGDSAGTPGSATLNTLAGRSAVANGATTCTISSNKLFAGAFVFVQPINNWTVSNGFWITHVAGVSFTVNLPAAAVGDLYFDWHVH